jgi:hypothetical protein
MLIEAPHRMLDPQKPDLAGAHPPETVETRLWLEEYAWLHDVLKSNQNVGPVFRFPDLISGCVSLVFSKADAARQIFGFMGAELVARPPNTVRRRESMWRQQYELLLELQRSPANRHPNPKFQLDHLTTACVALSRLTDGSGALVLQQARLNMANRTKSMR